ncbi:MAG: extracellular solute-binding protein [Candidatus Caldarchaeum sp.]
MNLEKYNVTRRKAISTGAKVATAAVVTGVVGGLAGYLAGTSGQQESTVTRTVTVGGGGGQTVTVTNTATATVTTTATRTVTAATGPVTPEVSITFASPEWLPGRLTGLIAQDFPAWSKANIGKAVEVKMDLLPWDVIFERLSTTLIARSKEPTLLISDSQWLGQFYVGGHIRRLNDYISRDPELQQLLNRFDPALVYFYMTFPQGNYDNIVGFAHEGDTLLFVYRHDLFTHPTERENFKAQYGYDLPANYEDWYPGQLDWYQIRDIAEFFTRKAGDELAGKRLEEDFYGIAVHMSRAYDAIACPFGSILYCHGEYWWDPETGEVEGYINSERAVKALEFYASLVQYSPPNALELWFDEANAVMQAGRVAMIYNWAGFLPSLFDPAASKVYNLIRVVPPPGHRGDDGIFRRYSGIGGQPMCINAYSDRVEEALAFIKYWFEPQNQRKWAEGGGGVCIKDIIQTEWFRNLTPYNRAYADSIPFQVDFWNVPFFAEMLTAVQEEIHSALAGAVSPRTALDNLARRHKEIIQRENYPRAFERYGRPAKNVAQLIRRGLPIS